jgi:hypothetical protein
MRFEFRLRLCADAADRRQCFIVERTANDM